MIHFLYLTGFAFLVGIAFGVFASGAITGLIAVKRCRNKGFVFAGLVILSINLILFLVPKR